MASISAYDGYFADHLPNGDRLSSSWSWCKTRITIVEREHATA